MSKFKRTELQAKQHPDPTGAAALMLAALKRCEGPLKYAYGNVSSVTASKVKDEILPALRAAIAAAEAVGIEETEGQGRRAASP